MRTLILTKQNKNKISNRLTLGFLSKLYNSTVVPAYNPKTGGKANADKLYDIHKPDIVLIHAHNKLARDIIKNFPSSCFKVMIAVDSGKTIKNNKMDFYNIFDMVLHRGFITEKMPANHYGLPFSVNENEFYPKKIEEKEGNVGFVGTVNERVYWQRKRAIDFMESNFLVNHGRNIKTYPEILRNHVMMLNSNEITTVYGKVFEIMLSGSIVLTPCLPGMEYLEGFSNDLFCLYKDDCSDIREQVVKHLKDKDMIKEKSKRSYEVCSKYHTDKTRVEELYIIICQKI